MKKVLIANRGEIAVRIIRTCRELGLRTVAIYSDADRTMPHVRLADEAYRVGAAPARESYLAMENVLTAARASGADAIHPGYGFLAENPEFAQRVIDAGILFVGPQPRSMSAMGDKTRARELAGAAGVPIVPGTTTPLPSPDEAATFCRQHGFPALLKAAGGGGGKGMRVVNSADELASAFQAAQSEATSAFGDGRVYIEKYLESPRHIEIQIVADRDGNTVHLGERECSIQRRHQKIVEETPSTFLDPPMRKAMGETAVNVARLCDYENAGTVEFLVDADRNFYFLEMNTRLQVEHPVTEMRTGIDLVALQIRLAMGERLPFSQEEIPFLGHALECRICAEDAGNEFLPATGRIVHLKPPEGIGVRVDRGIDEGDEVSVYYDSLMAKLVTWAIDRNAAIARMTRALREFEVLGITTNIPACLFVMQHPAFLAGDLDTGFLRKYLKPDQLARPSPREQRAAAIVCALMEQEAGGPVAPAPAGQDRAWERVGEDFSARPAHRPRSWKGQRAFGMEPWHE